MVNIISKPAKVKSFSNIQLGVEVGFGIKVWEKPTPGRFS